jgi:hypothetical protein
MKVSELIEILSEMDADAQVLIASQPNWPFEFAIAGVARRAEMLADDDGEPATESHEPGTTASDVFIVEGTQLRYGSKAAWETARRR